jgi:integrase
VAVQPKTFASYEETLRRYIIRPGVGIGPLEVRDVAPEDIEKMLWQAGAKSRTGALSRNTLRIIRATCSLLFDHATRVRKRDGDHLLMANPCRGVKLGTPLQRAPGLRKRAMTYEQVEQFLRAAKRHHPYVRKQDRWLAGRDCTLFRVLADTGVRPSEALALQWPDINLKARTLLVERAVTLGRQIKPTKTGNSRTVPLTAPLAEGARALAACGHQARHE